MAFVLASDHLLSLDHLRFQRIRGDRIPCTTYGQAHYHVVSGEVMAADVVKLDGKKVKTVQGSPVAIKVDGGTVMVGKATVTKTDIPTSNGVIHVIDTVLLPPAAK